MTETRRGCTWPTGARTALPAVLAALLALGGCRASVSLGPKEEGAKGEQKVSLQVVRGGGGGVLALVPVYIQNKGPFSFALDTGASHSVVSRRIAQQLNLASAGTASSVSGVFSSQRADLVKVKEWRVGGVKLPEATVAAIPLSEGEETGKLAGLLGSDALSHFEVITIDYRRQLLILRRGSSSSRGS